MKIENVTSKLEKKGFKCIDNLVLLDEIGSGTQGVVFKGRKTDDFRCNKLYAIKQVSIGYLSKLAKRRELFETEMATLSKIRHPNVVSLLRTLRSENNFYLVFKYCNQGNYYTFMKSRNLQYLSEKEAIYYLTQIANGFYELKRHKIMHRDFKLDNVLFNKNNLVIGDLGFAKKDVEVTNTVLGTYATMAYELLKSEGEGKSYNSKVDLWSIGCVFYEMLFGVPPFTGSDKYKIIKDIEEKTSKQSLPFPFENQLLRYRVFLYWPQDLY